MQCSGHGELLGSSEGPCRVRVGHVVFFSNYLSTPGFVQHTPVKVYSIRYVVQGGFKFNRSASGMVFSAPEVIGQIPQKVCVCVCVGGGGIRWCGDHFQSGLDQCNDDGNASATWSKVKSDNAEIVANERVCAEIKDQVSQYGVSV